MSQPLVSILVPCHNAEAFLRDTLESALAQTHAETEVVLVDDGSSDRSLAIAREFEPRVRVLSGPRQGASAARNRATGAARGEWLQYLDADDLLMPHAIAGRLAEADRSACDVVCSDWRRMVPGPAGGWSEGKLESGDPRAVCEDAELAVFKGFWAPPAAILYKRSVFDRIGGWHPNLPVIQDARFLFDAARLGARFAHAPGEGARYRQHASASLSSGSSLRFWEDVLRNNREIEALWTAHGPLSGPRRYAMAGAYALGARVTFPIDRDLFRSNLSELRRFPDFQRSPYLVAAVALERTIGHRAAVRIVNALFKLRKGKLG